MVAPKSFEWMYSGVSVLQADKAFLIGQNREFADDDEDDDPVSYVFRWDGSWASRPIPTIGVSVCTFTQPEPLVMIAGNNGVVVRASKTVNYEPEVVDDTDDGPQHVGDLREIRSIAGAAYVCGMGRTVYRCASPGAWQRIDDGVRVPTGDESDAGFNSIDGFGARDIYAVGWDGEIWHFDGRTWSAVPPITNVGLFRVVCASDGNVYVGGQLGLVIVGRQQTWREIRLPGDEHDITGAVEFQGTLYVATSAGLYRLEGGAFEKVDVAEKNKKIKTRPGESFGFLDARDGVIWSVGLSMAVYSSDGRQWSETSYE